MVQWQRYKRQPPALFNSPDPSLPAARSYGLQLARLRLLLPPAHAAALLCRAVARSASGADAAELSLLRLGQPAVCRAAAVLDGGGLPLRPGHRRERTAVARPARAAAPQTARCWRAQPHEPRHCSQPRDAGARPRARVARARHGTNPRATGRRHRVGLHQPGAARLFQVLQLRRGELRHAADRTRARRAASRAGLPDHAAARHQLLHLPIDELHDRRLPWTRRSAAELHRLRLLCLDVPAARGGTDHPVLGSGGPAA